MVQAVGAPGTGELLGAVAVPVGERELRDVEAHLLGLLPDGHRLGGPVGDGPAGPTATLGTPVAAGSELGAGLALVDPENTPVALLHPVAVAGDALTGTLHTGRARESGEFADLALRGEDLGHGERLLVLTRPPTDADTDTVERALSGPALVVVPDSPGAVVPLATLVASARTLAAGHPDARVVTAPLALRDPASDATLVRRLADAVGAPAVEVLDEGGDGGAAWGDVLRSVQEGRATTVPGVSPDVAAALLRWRPARTGRGLLLMFTGFSGSGKSTVARDLTHWLAEHTDRRTTLLDGDLVRQMLSAGLGFDREGRVANVRRIGYVGAEVARHGGIAICSPIAPYAETRAEVRAMVEPVGDFLLVHVNTPLEECERRDLKGLYARARAGIVTEFTGISDPYDVPEDADLRVDTSVLSRQEALDAVLDLLRDGGWLDDDVTGTDGPTP